ALGSRAVLALRFPRLLPLLLPALRARKPLGPFPVPRVLIALQRDFGCPRSPVLHVRHPFLDLIRVNFIAFHRDDNEWRDDRPDARAGDFEGREAPVILRRSSSYGAVAQLGGHLVCKWVAGAHSEKPECAPRSLS